MQNRTANPAPDLESLFADEPRDVRMSLARVSTFAAPSFLFALFYGQVREHQAQYALKGLPEHIAEWLLHTLVGTFPCVEYSDWEKCMRLRLARLTMGCEVGRDELADSIATHLLTMGDALSLKVATERDHALFRTLSALLSLWLMADSARAEFAAEVLFRLPRPTALEFLKGVEANLDGAVFFVPVWKDVVVRPRLRRLFEALQA